MNKPVAGACCCVEHHGMMESGHLLDTICTGLGVLTSSDPATSEQEARGNEIARNSPVIIAIAPWWAASIVWLYLNWLLNPVSLVALAYQASGARSRRANSVAILVSTASIVIFTALCTPRYVWASTANITFWMTAQFVASNLAVATQRYAIRFISAREW